MSVSVDLVSFDITGEEDLQEFTTASPPQIFEFVKYSAAASATQAEYFTIFGRDEVSYENPRIPSASASATQAEYFTFSYENPQVSSLQPNVPLAKSANTRPLKRRIPVHETVQQKLDAFYESKKIPHIIFHGASGTGKLTIVNDFIHRIYQGDKQRIKTNVMTVNCSHGKGIRFIRDELKFFAKTNIPTNSGVLFKTILLINAHHLTIDAQSALRRCIELFSYNTRFFIVLENKNKLLNPILSRFCEIYIPEYTDSENRIINLHQHSLPQTYDSSKDKFREYIDLAVKRIQGFTESSGRSQSAIFGRDENSYENRVSPINSVSQEISQVVEDVYIRGISCLDIMEWFDTHRESWTDKQYVNSIMCFHRIKTEFRCEKMLMFYMLDFIFCSTHELPIA